MSADTSCDESIVLVVCVRVFDALGEEMVAVLGVGCSLLG